MILFYSDVLDKTSESKEELIKEEKALVEETERIEQEKAELLEKIDKCVKDIDKYSDILETTRMEKRKLVKEYEEKFSNDSNRKNLFDEMDEMIKIFFS